MKKYILLFSTFFIINIVGCSKTGEDYLLEANKHLNNKNYLKAMKLYKQSCDKSNFTACNILAGIYHKGEIAEKNIEKANYFYENAVLYAKPSCENNNKEACQLLAKLYEVGNGVEKHLEIADSYNIKSCDLGAYGNCYYIARIKADNMEEFLKYMNKACEYNFADSCFIIGNTYLTGFNENMVLINKDVNKGISYINKACQLNNQYCANLADIYISGEDVEQNYKKAIEYYETSIDYYANLCTTYDENNHACRNIDIIKAKYKLN